MSNAGHVSGKVAVVTGSAHGMGAAHVRALAREGAIVAATDIIDDLGASLAEQLQSEGRDVSYYHHDVTSRAGWEAVVASVQQAHGPIDVLVNNADVQVRSMGIEADDREWDLWERGGRHESVFGQRAESGRGHVGVRAILQVVNQVQQYERVPFLAADLEIPSTGSRFFDGNQTRTSCAGYPYGQG